MPADADVKDYAFPPVARMLSVSVRQAGPYDIEAIAEIYGYHVIHGTASFEEDPPPVSEMMSRFEQLRMAGLPYLVAEYDNQIVGYAYAGPFRLRAAYRFTLEDSIYVSPYFTGRSVGKKLLMQLLHDAAALGYRCMVSVIGDSANEASIALHRSCGFEDVGTVRNVGYKHGHWLDIVLMQIELAGMPDT